MPDKSAETRKALRQKAQHARELAEKIAGDAGAQRLLAYAAELEARAEALDRVADLERANALDRADGGESNN